MKTSRILTAMFSVSLLIFSCDKNEGNNDETQIPETYNFGNVNYSGQTDRLNMLAEMTSEMKKTNNGETISGSTLLAMFENMGSPFSDATLNGSTKNLKSKCYDNAGTYNVSDFEDMMNYLGTQSASAANVWSPNNAGVATSGSKKYFFDPYGVEYTQLIEKGLMGAVFYYQAAEVYTREGKIGDAVDNETIIPGEGTAMEHHWDEAFGYLGIPTDLTVTNFDTKLDAGEVRYHGRYAEKGQKVGLNTVGNVLDALILGRYGISNKDYAKRDEAAEKVRQAWEMIVATTAVHYLNSAQNNFADDAIRNHALSEAYAFIFSLSYNSDKLISNQDLTSLKAYFETTPQGTTEVIPSFLNVTVQDLNGAKNILSNTYGLEAVKNTL